MNLFSKLFVLLSLLLIILGIPKIVFAEDPLGSWSSTLQLPYFLASHGSFSHANKVSVVGGSAVTGQSKFDVLTATPSADGSINSWTTTSLTPTALIFHSLAKKDNYIYVLGGREENPGSALNHVPKVFVGSLNINGTVNSWTQLNSLPQGTSIGNAVVVGGRIYYAGGFNGSGEQDEVYFADINFDGTLGAWQLAGLLPEPMSGFGMFTQGNNMFIVGGLGASSGFLAKTYRAAIGSDGQLGGWQELSSLPEPIYRAGVIKVGSKLIIIGGYNGSNFLDKVYYVNINSDGTLGSWQLSGNHIPQPVCCGAVAVLNNYLYLTGGFNGNYLNTVYYAPVNVVLPVPYYSQNVLPWGPTEYDHAASLGFSNTLFERWGCAVTSAAMVLNYHGMTEFENGIPIDPSSLNEWLKDNNGYQTGVDDYGKPFSKFVWSAIPRLTEDLFPEKAPYKLVHNRPETSLETILKDDLSNEATPSPGILGVTNADTDMHFVIAKGFDADTYFINDPEWNYPDLQSFNNDFFQLDRYLRSNTNFSYIEMSASEGVEIAVVDSESRKTGRQVIDGVVQTFDEIPNAVYSHQNPISNPSELGDKENLGFGFNEFLLPEPSGGQYTIILTSLENQTYTLNIAALQANGDDANFQMVGIISQNSSDEFGLDYSQDDPSVLDEVVTFDSLINDIHALRASGDISSRGVYVSLLAKTRVAKGLSGNIWTKKASIRLLESMQKEITKQKGKGVSETAYNILNNDIQTLIAILSP